MVHDGLPNLASSESGRQNPDSARPRPSPRPHDYDEDYAFLNNEEWALMVAKFKEDEPRLRAAAVAPAASAPASASASGVSGSSTAEEEYLTDVEWLKQKYAVCSSEYETYMKERAKYDGMNVDNSWLGRAIRWVARFFPVLGRIPEYLHKTKGFVLGAVSAVSVCLLVGLWLFFMMLRS